MKPYGVRVIDSPDIADIQATGRAGHVSRYPGRSGCYKSYIRDSAARKITRRYWKRLARREGCKEAKEE
jgi:hypothetical protein